MPLSVLIVEDSPSLRRALRFMLESDDRFRALPEDATDGLAAIELARIHEPDAVILDMEMPGMNGLAALPRLRALLPRARIVMFSSSDEPSLRAAALAAGCDAYLEKATDLPRLLDVIAE